jgi:hypothetical protein
MNKEVWNSLVSEWKIFYIIKKHEMKNEDVTYAMIKEELKDDLTHNQLNKTINKMLDLGFINAEWVKDSFIEGNTPTRVFTVNSEYQDIAIRTVEDVDGQKLYSAKMMTKEEIVERYIKFNYERWVDCFDFRDGFNQAICEILGVDEKELIHVCNERHHQLEALGRGDVYEKL